MKATVVENLWLALGTLTSHKLRSVLTVLGVVIGTTCVIAIGSILTGMSQNFTELLHQFGPNTIFISKWNQEIRFGPSSREQRLRRPLSYADYEMVLANCTACRSVGLQIYARVGPRSARYKGEQVDAVPYNGNTPAFADAMNLQVATGRFFTETENQRRADVCVIGADLADTFFPRGNALGEQIFVAGHAFEVIGVLDKYKAFALDTESSQNKQVIVPYETYLAIYPSAKDHFMVAQAQPGRISEAVDQIREALRRSRKCPWNQPDNFGVATADNIIEQFHQITAATALVMIVISSIGLLVGGVGVMNIMLVSVTERTREIGVRKAIGARRTDIILQFLMEASTLTGMGGVLGILLGIIISLLIQVLLPRLPSVVPLWAVALGFIVSVAVGVFFGMWPAVKAARLDPVEALRYE